MVDSKEFMLLSCDTKTLDVSDERIRETSSFMLGCVI